MGVDRNDIPDKYLCELCEPRKVEKAKAVALQIKKRQEIAGEFMLLVIFIGH